MVSNLGNWCCRLCRLLSGNMANRNDELLRPVFTAFCVRVHLAGLFVFPSKARVK